VLDLYVSTFKGPELDVDLDVWTTGAMLVRMCPQSKGP
jgi:hypothetical protein